MRHSNIILFFLLSGLLLMIGAGCRRQSDRLYPFGWTKTDPTFDTLTVRAERAALNMEPDSVIMPLLHSMEMEAKKDPATPEKLSRFHYWNARMKLRHAEIDEAMDEFLVSLALTDSARLPYDVARIRWNMELDEPEGPDGYFDALNKLALFRSFNDLPMQGAYLMTLGGLMNNIGNPSAALRYFNSADSVLRIAGCTGQVNRNVINRAISIERTGRDRESAAMLRAALKDSVFCREPIAVNIALWNLYLVTDSLPTLQEAYRRLDGDLEEESMRPLYEAHLVKQYARRGMRDSVAALIPRVSRDTSLLFDGNALRDYYLGLAEGEKMLGNYQRAAELYARGSAVMWELDQNERADEIIRLDQRHQIDEALHKLELQRKDRTLWLVVALVATALLTVVLIAVYRRRLSKQRTRSLASEKASAKARRKVLALEIAMEENRRLGDNIRETVGSLEKEGLVDPSVPGALEATLKSHDISRPAQDDFVATFADVDPTFLEALDRKYPALSKTERRLAVYIFLGLDNKHISRLTGVRPESVKQARWRLRNKLDLPEGVSLEEEMKKLAEK